jgi:hypothetical protein
VSTFLQRLASQAVGAGEPRVCAAARTRATVPIVMPAGHASGMPDAGGLQAADRTSHAPDIDRDANRDAASRPLELLVPALAGPQRAAPRPAAPPDVHPREVADAAAPAAPIPEPLLAVVERAVPVQIAVGSIQPAARPAQITRAGAEPSEVHVHIGRIEVTAVPVPAPPRKREATPRRSLALSDYLAKRRSS